MLRHNSGGFPIRVACSLAAIALGALLTQRAEAFHSRPEADPKPPLPIENREALFFELASFVGRNGWSADLGGMCKAFAIGRSDGACRFWQIAIETDQDVLDSHGFNLPADPADQPYVLIFHLRPLVGEFFIVSPKGRLLATFFRARGIDYARISDENGTAAFEKEVAFWQSNLARIEQNFENPQLVAPRSEHQQ